MKVLITPILAAVLATLTYFGIEVSPELQASLEGYVSLLLAAVVVFSAFVPKAIEESRKWFAVLKQAASKPVDPADKQSGNVQPSLVAALAVAAVIALTAAGFSGCAVINPKTEASLSQRIDGALLTVTATRRSCIDAFNAQVITAQDGLSCLSATNDARESIDAAALIAKDNPAGAQGLLTTGLEALQYISTVLAKQQAEKAKQAAPVAAPKTPAGIQL